MTDKSKDEAVEMSDEKKRELLEKYGYNRNSRPSDAKEGGTCGKTQRRTCC